MKYFEFENGRYALDVMMTLSYADSNLGEAMFWAFKRNEKTNELVDRIANVRKELKSLMKDIGEDVNEYHEIISRIEG